MPLLRDPQEDNLDHAARTLLGGLGLFVGGLVVHYAEGGRELGP